MLKFEKVSKDFAHETAQLVNNGNDVKEPHTIDSVLKQRHFIARENNKIAGCIGLAGVSYYMDEIQHIRVKPEFRRQGIGSYLVQEAIKKSPKPILISVIKKDNAPSIKLHQKLGFKEIVDFENKFGNHVAIYLYKK